MLFILSFSPFYLLFCSTCNSVNCLCFFFFSCFALVCFAKLIFFFSVNFHFNSFYFIECVYWVLRCYYSLLFNVFWLRFGFFDWNVCCNVQNNTSGMCKLAAGVSNIRFIYEFLNPLACFSYRVTLVHYYLLTYSALQLTDIFKWYRVKTKNRMLRRFSPSITSSRRYQHNTIVL